MIWNSLCPLHSLFPTASHSIKWVLHVQKTEYQESYICNDELLAAMHY